MRKPHSSPRLVMNSERSTLRLARTKPSPKTRKKRTRQCAPPIQANTPSAPMRSRKNCTRSFALARSEEHTSELQSQFHLVCRLLLEKHNSIVERNWKKRPARVNLDSMTKLTFN